MTKREILLICGSHRTGTSALTGTLEHLGWATPKSLMPGSRWNLKGYFESTVIRDFHDTILRYLDRPVYDLRETPGDVDFDAMMQGRFDQMTTLLQSEFGRAKKIAIKDPRLCRLLPLWRAYAKASKQPIHVILPMRDPQDAAASLYRRNGFSMAEGLSIWLREVTLAESQSRGMSRGVVHYTDLISDWKSAMEGLMQQLGLDAPSPDDAKAAEISEFLSMKPAKPAKFPTPQASEPWPGHLAQGVFAATGKQMNGDALDAHLAALNTATRLMGTAKQPGHQTNRAISAVGPTIELLIEHLEQTKPLKEATELIAANADIEDLKSQLEEAENNVSQARIQALKFQEALKELRAENKEVLERLTSENEEALDRLSAENEEIQASLKDRFAEIGDMVAYLEKADLDKAELTGKLRKTDKSYKELLVKFVALREKVEASEGKAAKS